MSYISQKAFKQTRPIILVMAVALFLLAGFTELFHSSNLTANLNSPSKGPINKAILANISSLYLRNSLGEFELNKIAENWKLSSPRNVDAPNELLEKIINSISTIEVKRVFDKDPINLANFSLNNPAIEIEISSFEKAQKIQIGLFNSIDNTTYIMVDEDSVIYQVKMFDISFQKLSLGDFINSKLVALSTAELSQLVVKKYRQTVLDFKKNKDQWLQRSTKLSSERVSEYVDTIANTNVQMILDKRSEGLSARIDKLIQAPLFEINISSTDKQLINLKITGPISELPDLKFEPGQFVLVKSSLSDHPVLVDKRFLTDVNQSLSKFRAPRF